MKNPRCIANWTVVRQLLDMALRYAKTVTVTWDQGTSKGALRVVIEFGGHDPNKSQLFEEFDRRYRKATPEAHDDGRGNSP